MRARLNAVVVAPPGSGKTTRVPPALLDVVEGTVVVLQPRRVAARMAARRIAEERGGRVGGEVGYRTRFERKVSSETRIEFVTEGLLLRRLQADPFLEGVGAVVLDELHERSLDIDLALALLREVQQEARDDLRLVVMSATLDPGPVQAFLGGEQGCDVVLAEGRAFPVELAWLPRESTRRIEEQVASAVRRVLAGEARGHVLVFLPSVRTIREAERALRDGDLPGDVRVLALHGSLPPKEQDAALAPWDGGRKVVLATNVAETSVTFDGVRTVVDSGLAVVARFDAATGVTRLERERIARDSADQRAGRAGRTGPGRCLRLWTSKEDAALASASAPEVRRADLASACLQLLAWGTEPAEFGWFERPPPGALERAETLLRSLGAWDETGLTPVGRQLAALPVHPRLGRVLLEARRMEVLASAATAAALTEGRDVARRQQGYPDEDDLMFRLRLVAEAEMGGGGGAAMAEVRRVRDQLIRAAERLGGDVVAGGPEGGTGHGDAPALVRALLAGFPDRVGLRRGNGDRYLLASGQGARLSSDSACRGADLVLALALDGGRRGQRSEAWIRMAVVLEADWLGAEEVDELVFDGDREAVVARRVRRFGELVLDERPSHAARDPLEQARLLEEAARGVDGLLTLDKDAESMLGRVDTLRRLRPELELPDLTSLDALLPVLCAERRSFAELRRAPVTPAVEAVLSWEQRKALDAEVPARMRVPSGSTVRVQYSRDGSPPVMAARIQQLFGMMETPTVGRGRLPMRVHLLAPNGRPAQVTQDLASFWTNTWPEVRKDLRGRYPKHAWPEDPTTAIPEDRPKRRRR